MTNPHNSNGSKRTHPSDDDAFLAAVHRDPEAAARALIQATDRLLAECPLQPSPVEGSFGLCTGVCPLCRPGY